MKKFNYNDYSSILDIDLQELLSLDFGYVKELFLNEIKNFHKLDRFKQETFIYNLFSLRDQEDMNEACCFCEHRFFIDLISSLKKIDKSYFIDCLSKYFNNCSDYEILVKIFDFYDNHEDFEIDKLNYVLRSSLNVYNGLTIEMFDTFFNSRIFQMFDKETLSQLYREAFSNPPFLKKLFFLFSEENHKSLYIISLMANKIKKYTSHNSEFIDRFLTFSNDDKYSLLTDIYNYYIKDKSLEREFRDNFFNSNDYFEIDEFIRIILDEERLSLSNNRDNFIDSILELHNIYHYSVFEEGALDKIRNGTFDVNHDFKEIVDKRDLKFFKKAFLYNIYGISLKDAESFMKNYGIYFEDLKKGVLDKDKSILSILETFKKIISLNCFDYEKIRVLQLLYLDNILRNGINKGNNCYSNFILEALFNRMIINTYNKKLLDVKNLKKIKEVDGVKLYDSGFDFDIILTSLSGVGDFYVSNVNMKSKWNTALFSDGHGLSCSHITNENMGVISLDSVLLGFDHIPEYSLNAMGPSDIFSRGRNYDLRSDFVFDYESFKKYYPVSVLPNETRYGYNELLVDRFLMDDKDGVLKLQPSYVVFYKFSEDLEAGSFSFDKALKTAKDFDIPIVVIDVEKIKDNEKRKIDEKIEQLFNSDKLDSCLLQEIVRCYMNNYTGGLVLAGSYNYEDFSISDMEGFFEKVFEKIDNILDIEEKRRWIDTLMDVYVDEERKYSDSKNVTQYSYSVKNFILEDFNIKEKILDIKKNMNYQTNFLSKYEYVDELKVILNLVNIMGNSYYKVSEILDGYLISSCVCKERDVSLIENLVGLYFFEDCNLVVSDLSEDDFDCISLFKCTEDFDYLKSLKDSSYDIEFIPMISDKLDNVLRKIEEVSDKDFLQLFLPVIESYSLLDGRNVEDISCCLLEKKKNIRNEFNKVQNYFCNDNVKCKRK